MNEADTEARESVTGGYHVARLGESALLLTFSDAGSLAIQQGIWALSAEIRSWPEAGELQEIVPGIGSLLLQVRAGYSQAFPGLLARIDEAWSQVLSRAHTETAPPRRVEIAVRYGGKDGPDLGDVARYAGLTEDEVIARHSGGHYRVYCLGFQPGFAYLGGMDEQLAMPRRSTPRLRIPPGSVAIGGRQTGIYPAESPGGWHIIGRTEQVLFDSSRSAPSLLEPGDSLRFVISGPEPTIKYS